jgi:glycerol-3-phosphate dehydrogenase
MNRQDILSSLETRSPAVLIIGGGINGVGVLRDLAANGVDVLLVERNDFCSGSSAASSHMAHGGIRYLENGEFRLVREAVRERNRLIENAPHIVRPLPTVIPIFKFWSGLLNAPLKFLDLLDRPSERGAFIIKAGLMLYDAFTHGQGTVPTHKFDKRETALEKYPRLNPDIQYAATYYDGSILSPERLTLELILDAEAEGSHARALNYCALAGVSGSNVSLLDEETGRIFDISPHLIINAAGPWIDSSNHALGIDRHYIGGTKGSHLVLDHPELREAIGRNEFFFENKDGRIVLIFPYFNKVIIGTSDIPMENPDDARCTEGEVDYFIELVSRVFPDIKVGREHIIFRFSGVRPLEFSNAKTTGQISRDHSLLEDSFGGIPVYSLVGGKWTTYRAFAEQVTNKVLKTLGLPRKADTQRIPIGGGRDFPWTGYALLEFLNRVESETGLGGLEPKRLFDKYGTRALEYAAYITKGSDAKLKSMPTWSLREIEYLVQKEKVLHLDDLVLRRSNLAWLGLLTREKLNEFAGVLGDTFKWDEEKKNSEILRTLALLSDRHGVNLDTGLQN